VVFADEERREKLNSIVHPKVRAWMAERVAAAPEGSIVVQDIPLLVEGGSARVFEYVIVVDAEDETRFKRLVGDRGMAEDEARARIAAQASREQRNAAADWLIDNGGSTAELPSVVSKLWRALEGLRAQP